MHALRGPSGARGFLHAAPELLQLALALSAAGLALRGLLSVAPQFLDLLLGGQFALVLALELFDAVALLLEAALVLGGGLGILGLLLLFLAEPPLGLVEGLGRLAGLALIGLLAQPLLGLGQGPLHLFVGADFGLGLRAGLGQRLLGLVAVAAIERVAGLLGELFLLQGIAELLERLSEHRGVLAQLAVELGVRLGDLLLELFEPLEGERAIDLAALERIEDVENLLGGQRRLVVGTGELAKALPQGTGEREVEACAGAGLLHGCEQHRAQRGLGHFGACGRHQPGERHQHR